MQRYPKFTGLELIAADTLNGTLPGDNDRAGLYGEGCCAVDGGDGAEGLAIDAIEADLLVVIETGDVDETTG